MKIHKILPHINLVMSVMMLTLIVVNSINPMMTFLVGDEFEIVLICLVAIGLLSSAATIAYNAKCEKDNEQDK